MKIKKIKIDSLDVYTTDEKVARELYNETFLPKEFEGLISDYHYFDCGAHQGIHLLKLRQKFPNIKVTCFEPNPDSFKILKLNSKKMDNVILINKAVSNKVRKTKFFTDLIDSRGDSITESWGKRPKQKEISVDTTLLSDYIIPLSWVKLDVEGEELNVLKDLEESDKLKDVSGFHIEIHITNNDIGKYNDIKRTLLRNNFRILIDKEKNFRYMLPSSVKKWKDELNPKIYTITAVKN